MSSEELVTIPTTSAKEKIIIQITDSHLMDRAEAAFVKINPEASFLAVLEDLQEKFPHIDAIIHTGDVAQVAKPETYHRYQQHMQKLGIPFYQIPGNHDDITHFPFETPNPIPGVLTFDHWRIILLNSAVPDRIDGWIGTEQLIHLERILEQSQQYDVILACHHHPLEMQSHWIDQHKLKNTKQLTEILQNFNNIKAVICGHVHQDSLNVWNGIQFISTPATSVQFKPKSVDFALDDTAPGYRSFRLKENGSFESQVHRLTHFLQNINKDISGY